MISPETGHPALTDGRTGLPNRLQFETVYRFLFAGADRGAPFALMMVEMDVRDEATFREAASRIARATRSSDLLAHFGDGRFVILLLACNLHGARIAADRMAAVLADFLGSGFAVGLAVFKGGMEQPSDLIEALEAAVADARASGGGTEIGLA
jgi:GGDEF domain-containing protein